MSVALQGHKAQGLHQKYLNLYSEDEGLADLE